MASKLHHIKSDIEEMFISLKGIQTIQRKEGFKNGGGDLVVTFHNGTFCSAHFHSLDLLEDEFKNLIEARKKEETDD